jgi:putative hydrolase of HD superfamily
MAKRRKKTMKNDMKTLALFLSEAGLLKQIKRSGWWVVGIKDPESVAEHSFRCAVLGFVLALEADADPYKVMTMALFNDIHETRIGDLHKMAQRYVKIEEAEEVAFYEQIDRVPSRIKKELTRLRREYVRQETKESILARDADILECLLQAKEYAEQGYSCAKKFMQKAPRFLKSLPAKRLFSAIKNTHLNTWWEQLTRFTR